MTHELKCWPTFFKALQNGSKTFELRRNDRDFKDGDHLVIREWEPDKEDYTGAVALRFHVSHIMHGPLVGLEPGWCIMSLKQLHEEVI